MEMGGRKRSTSSDGSDERLDGDGPRIVPGANDQHHSQWLGLDVDGVRDGNQVLLHRSGGGPLLQLADGQVDLRFQPQGLIQLCPHNTLWKIDFKKSGFY